LFKQLLKLQVITNKNFLLYNFKITIKNSASRALFSFLFKMIIQTSLFIEIDYMIFVIFKIKICGNYFSDSKIRKYLAVRGLQAFQ